MEMNDKEAADVLLEMLKRGDLSDKEREAVKKGVGVLSWTQLAEKRLKTMGERRANRGRRRD